MTVLGEVNAMTDEAALADLARACNGSRLDLDGCGRSHVNRHTAFVRHVGDGGGTMTGKRSANSGSIIALIGSVLRSLAAISIADPTAPAPIANLNMRAIYSIRSTVTLWAT
jgi:hypothetical protein